MERAPIITVSIDHRTDLGTHYAHAERGAETTVNKATRCTVLADCGETINAGDRAVMWSFTRRNVNSTSAGLLCTRCDAELVEVADITDAPVSAVGK
jgi:hypothetical protein